MRSNSTQRSNSEVSAVASPSSNVLGSSKFAAAMRQLAGVALQQFCCGRNAVMLVSSEDCSCSGARAAAGTRVVNI